MTKYNPDIHHRRSIRLRGYDYSQAGAYFITICTHNRECCLADVVNGLMKFTIRGAIAREWWFKIPDRFPNVELDEFVVMPNHTHGIVVITDDGGVAKQKQTLGKIVAYYKYQTTKIINQYDETPGNRVWQRDFYDHIIRDERSLNNIRRYIVENPLRWIDDPENPTNIDRGGGRGGETPPLRYRDGRGGGRGGETPPLQ